MRYYILIGCLLLLFSCTNKPDIIHKEQLILEVPKELLVEPKDLKQL